ncbi:hypothetical protein JCM18899A_38830 [Nocardioides sp. AN3]
MLCHATTNIELLITGGTRIVALFFGILYGSALLGVAVAFILKRARPATYARIGRQ